MSANRIEEVVQIAQLAKLELSEEEAEQAVQQLDHFLRMAQKLNEVDTSQVEPTIHVLPLVNVLREDVPRDSLPVEELLKNTAEHQDGQVKVPSILEE